MVKSSWEGNLHVTLIGQGDNLGGEVKLRKGNYDM